MLPSLVVDEVRRGVAETLRVQFEPSTELFKDAIRRLIEEPGWIKGPYIQLGLPFIAGDRGRHFFPDFATEHPAHRHQEQAWRRTFLEHRSTLIATGTGSGKTECFLYPILAQAAQTRAQGAPGIKAVIIYPMNALADDQAKRIAELIHRTPAFAGLRAGLFVGSGRGRYRPGQAGRSPDRDHAAMGADHVITDKDILRDQPPDILLTNYKMLDFLLIRPKDQPLWRFNAPDTLNYLVVDELHTFDGAQGTDLAMLIRRLRHRLKCDPERLVSIGTSATLGDAGDTRPLRDYAGQIFAAAFDEQAVITEQRQGFDAFIGNRVVEHLLAEDETVLQAIRPRAFDRPQDAVAQFLPAFFADPETLSALHAGLDTPQGRIRLGEELKKHLLFQSLIRLATQAPITVDEIASKLQRTLSARLLPQSRALISALLTLVAWARAPTTPDDAAGNAVGAASAASPPIDGVQDAAEAAPTTAPQRALTNAKLTHLVTLRVQLWMQELRRVLATVSRNPADIALCSEAAILSQRERLRLPLIQCRHCHATGWLTVKAPQDSRVNASLDRIYGGFFARYPDTLLARLYPRDPGSASSLPIQTLCAQCGHLGHERLTQCSHCQGEDLVPVQVANAQRTLRLRDDAETKRDAREVSIHDDRCPVCGERGGQLIIGAQTTSLAAHAVERLWAARLNDHKKLILFSDSVQDAAHRAGYIESKTEGMLTRAALAQALTTLPEAMPWDRALDAIGRAWLDPASPLALSPRDFVARFIPPSMESLRDWRGFLTRGELPSNSRLPGMLAQRLQWRAAEELAHRSDRGRTLSRVGIAVLFPDLDDLRTLADTLTPELRELGGGLERLRAEQVRHWTLGTLLALIHAGAVFHLELESHAESGDFGAFEFSPKRKAWIPHRGQGVAPRFLTRDPGRHGFLHLQERDGNPLLSWAKLALGLVVSSPGIVTLAYETLLRTLEPAGLGRFVLLEHRGERARVFGLTPERLKLYQRLHRLVTPSGAQSLWVPAEAVETLRGLPAWNSPGETFRPDGAPARSWWHARLQGGDVVRVIAHEHTGLLERDERLALQDRFMARADAARPWYENLLSATPTLEMGIDIGSLSSVMLGGVPPNQANFIQRVGRAGRRDGNAAVFTIADATLDGHDQYHFANPLEMLHGAVDPPAIYLNAAEVLRRQLYAFFFDHWVAEERPDLPDKLSEPLDQVARMEGDIRRFPFNYLDFVSRHEPVLFDAFQRMLGEALTDETRLKLESFITGGDRYKNLRARFLAFFEETQAERESWKKRRKAIKTEIQRLKKRPEDEQTLAEIDLLEKEHAGLGQRIQQLNNDYLLEALTNAGLLPNYAFPEEGVALTTIIHGAKSSGEEYAVPVHRYSRPAHAALSEFAPRNTFYAHKSKVEIDQIDLSVEPAADYRFCASCHNLTPLTEPDARADVCPRCGDSHWLDGSQVRPVLRLRRAVANIRRADKTRITETDEARNPKFYARRLLMSFALDDVRHAWTLESSQAIYGFELLARAVFHDLNLGQPPAVDSAEYATLIAGDDSAKAGFTLCKRCGMVQPSGNRGREGSRAARHTPDCPDRHATGTDHLLERLFLYRRFESECLRILVPRGFGSGERTTYSFMSALQLGLRRRFGGKVDHLRFETMAERGAADGGGKTYILIYDSVPGGTGYLQQLLAGDADTLTEVLAAAHAVIRDCGCAVKPEQDGCYQCVFHYRQGRNRRHISRAVALEMLEALVQGELQRKPVKCLSEIEIDPSFGSELERRFLPALKHLGGHLDGDRDRFPPVRVTLDVKGCKTAYLLTVGPHRYWVDTQVPIEDSVSGQVLCQPDFVISKTQAAGAMRPIAVFVDGWEYHQHSLTEDARKRATLMLRGDYRVWSVTFEDIEAAHRLKSGTDLESPLSLLMTASGERLRPPETWPPLAVEDLRANALALLVRLLGQPRSSDRDPLDTLAWTARHLLIRSVRRPNEVTEAIQARAAAVLKALPDWLRHEAQTVHLHGPSPLAGEGLGRGGTQGDASHGSSNLSRSAVQWIGLADPRFITGKNTASSYPIIGALVLDDRAISADPKAGRVQWRQWLRLANLLQGLPGVALLTQSMLDAQGTLAVVAPGAETPIADDTGWSQVLEAGEFVERLAPGFAYLARSGMPAPDAIGIEHEDGDDYRLAEALWESARLALLTTAQLECAARWTQAGYQVIAESESWWLTVEAALSQQAM